MYRGVIPLANTRACIVKLSNTRGRVSGNNLGESLASWPVQAPSSSLARCTAGGFVQGGILSAMLDATMSAAVFAMTHGKLYPPTISMTVNFLAPAQPGLITGEARVTQL